MMAIPPSAMGGAYKENGLTPQLELMRKISIRTDSRILFVVMDGLGGHPVHPGGPSELEMAARPNLDRLAREGVTGLLHPIAPGITPGSGPAHLALFGYDPIHYDVGRGLLSALGVDFPLQKGDVAARMNFATVAPDGRIADRRAGRISSETGARLCALLDGTRIEGVTVHVRPEKEYRAVLVMRGEGLSAALTDTDPQQLDVPPRPVEALDPAAEPAARTANAFVARAREILAAEPHANAVLLRGFEAHRAFPLMEEIYRLRPAAIAVYPMYKGVTRLIGMDVLDAGDSLETEFETLRANLDRYDFFYFHVKKTDSAGEDGDAERKAREIEAFDSVLGRIRGLGFDVIAVTGDHSTPAVLRSHSWHPVPVALWGPHCRPDDVDQFTEAACLRGGLGQIPSTDLMPLVLSNAGKLVKFGA
jgi:2,3-bisphosphoglycerate-independent phosphoglycerate mutase